MKTKALIKPVEEILDLSNLHLPKKPKVEAIQWYEFVDNLGDNALRVTVLLSDNPEDDERLCPYLAPISNEIHSELRANGVDLFPYVRFVTEKEHLSEHDQ